MSETETSPVRQAEALLTAIETLKTVEVGKDLPTDDQLASMRAFPGAGTLALQLFPDPKTKEYENAAWQQRGERLRNLCTQEEYDSLLRSTFSAFYTSRLVMEACFKVLKRTGVPDSGRVLEPGCGIGNFLQHAPDEMRMVGVELDRLSARLATQLW